MARNEKYAATGLLNPAVNLFFGLLMYLHKKKFINPKKQILETYMIIGEFNNREIYSLQKAVLNGIRTTASKKIKLSHNNRWL